jgi:hypothetical protein
VNFKVLSVGQILFRKVRVHWSSTVQQSSFVCINKSRNGNLRESTAPGWTECFLAWMQSACTSSQSPELQHEFAPFDSQPCRKCITPHPAAWTGLQSKSNAMHAEKELYKIHCFPERVSIQ